MIGIDDYTEGWPRLSGAAKDARLVAEELEREGFDVTLKTNLNSEQLKDALNSFFIFKGEDPDARLFVWFAGHGHTMNNEGYLVPADAPLPKEGAKFKYRALSLRRFRGACSAGPVKHAMAVFDSCFSGTIFFHPEVRAPSRYHALRTLPVRQFVSVGGRRPGSLRRRTFPKTVHPALRGEEKADANGDGYVTVPSLACF